MRSSTAQTIEELFTPEWSEVVKIYDQLRRFKTLGWGIKELTKCAAVFNKAIHVENSYKLLPILCSDFFAIFEANYNHLLIDTRECHHSINNSIIKQHNKLEIPEEISTFAKRTVLLARSKFSSEAERRSNIEGSAERAARYGDPEAMMEWARINFNKALLMDIDGREIKTHSEKTNCLKTAIYWFHRSYILGATDAALELLKLAKNKRPKIFSSINYEDVSNYAKLACVDLKVLSAAEAKLEGQEIAGVVFHDDESISQMDSNTIFLVKQDNFRKNLDEIIKSKVNLVSLAQSKSDEPDCEVIFHGMNGAKY